MTPTISFFTPVTYQDGKYKFLAACDEYFNFGRKKALFAENQGHVTFIKFEVAKKSGCLKRLIVNILKITSYFTLILPLIMLMGKDLARHYHQERMKHSQYLIKLDKVDEELETLKELQNRTKISIRLLKTAQRNFDRTEKKSKILFNEREKIIKEWEQSLNEKELLLNRWQAKLENATPE